MVLSEDRVDIRDSTTEAVTYRYQVLGKRTLTFEEQDGKEHVGQAVPPEECWLVLVTEEGGAQLNRLTPYHLYFRVGDLSLREVAEPGGRRGTYFEYSSSHVDDDETKSVVVVSRGPFRSEFGPPVMDWPAFPLAVDPVGASGVQKVSEIKTRYSGAEVTGARVVLGNGNDTTTQIWIPGLPWWIAADRNGLQKSRLIEMSDNQLTGRINP